jgi:hypothetical protein
MDAAREPAMVLLTMAPFYVDGRLSSLARLVYHPSTFYPPKPQIIS